MSLNVLRTALERADEASLADALAADAAVWLPVHDSAVRGREDASRELAGVLRMLEDLAYIGQASGEELEVLRFRARAGSVAVEGAVLAHLDVDGRVAELSVLVRPLAAVQALAQP